MGWPGGKDKRVAWTTNQNIIHPQMLLICTAYIGDIPFFFNGYNPKWIMNTSMQLNQDEIPFKAQFDVHGLYLRLHMEPEMSKSKGKLTNKSPPERFIDRWCK